MKKGATHFDNDPTSQDHVTWSGRDAGEDLKNALTLVVAAKNLIDQAGRALGRPADRGERCGHCDARHFDYTERKLHQTQSSLSSQGDRLGNVQSWLEEIMEIRNE
jgi:hypothetical protein|tara:strand:- start:537 stop:854 length:318 start_codon:yes stop_codon:yes gene_type:complete